MKKRILFIGNFLHNSQGTTAPIVGVMSRLNDNYVIYKASSYENTILRLSEMLFKTTFYNYDIIHIDTYSTAALKFADFTSKIAIFRKKKIIFNLHGGGLFEKYCRRSEYVSKILNRATTIITPSLFLASRFAEAGFKVINIPNAIDFEKFPFKEKIHDSHKLLWIRAFSPEYNPLLAINIFKRVKEKYPNATLTMIGPDKGCLSDAQVLINELKLENSIGVMGSVPNNQLCQYYHSHDVFINTTSYESFGVAVCEAAACGIPIVSTSVGELPYIWSNNKNILLSNNMTAEEMAELSIKYLENSDLRNKIITNAYKRVIKFDWQVIKKQWKEILK